MKLTKEFNFLNLIFFASIILYFNFTASFNSGDDVWAFNQNLTITRIIGMYQNWSGRLVAYVLNVYMIHNPIVFRILNSLIMIAMPLLTWFLVDKNKKLNNLSLLILLFLLYDYKEMRTAGIVTTYITYYWSLFANILFYIIIKRYLQTNKVLSWDLFWIALLGIFVCNSEIGALCNTVILFTILIINYYRNRNINPKIALLSIIPLLSIVFFLTCPGIHRRTIIETSKSLPEFSSYSVIVKFYLGFSETLLHYFSTKSAILLLFLGALLVTSVCKGLNVAYLILVSLISFVVPTYSSDLILNFSNVNNFMAYAFFCILLSFSFFVILALCKIFKDNKRTLYLLIFVLLLGFITRLMMGFSPTLYASNTRTFLYCDFAILISTYYLLKESKTDICELCPVFLAMFAFPYFISNLFPN